jgi:hypothetical protein
MDLLAKPASSVIASGGSSRHHFSLSSFAHGNQYGDFREQALRLLEAGDRIEVTRGM